MVDNTLLVNNTLVVSCNNYCDNDQGVKRESKMICGGATCSYMVCLHSVVVWSNASECALYICLVQGEKKQDVDIKGMQ